MSAVTATLAGAEANTEPHVRPGLRAELRPARTAPLRLEGDWQDLARDAAEPNAFAEPWFAAPSLRNLEIERELRMVEVWDGTVLIGLLPLCMSGTYAHLPIPHAENWLHSQSFLGTPLIRRGREQEFWVAALQILDGESWVGSFLHLSKLIEGGPVFQGLVAAARQLGRRCDVVHRHDRALLESDLPPEAYYEQTVRKKKRKELKRLSNRLAELGRVETSRLTSREELVPWCDDFLRLEASGWKGQGGTALTCDASTKAFFRESIEAAFDECKLAFLRLDLDGRAIAMLVNFLAPPGSFSFKIAFDEDYARFSPGVLIQIENLQILNEPEVAWMDSCAVEDHPMINSLWGERRRLVQATVPLRGLRHQLIFRICRTAERTSAAVRRLSGRRRAMEGDSPND